jgi:hypothetical protein
MLDIDGHEFRDVTRHTPQVAADVPAHSQTLPQPYWQRENTMSRFELVENAAHQNVRLSANPAVGCLC